VVLVLTWEWRNFVTSSAARADSNLMPTVIVATTRALKMHGGGPEVTPGKPLAETYTKEDLFILKEGCKNLLKHIQNCKKFGVKVIVAINRFA